MSLTKGTVHYDIQSGHRLTDDLEIHFIEIPKFQVKSIKELKRLERWMAYFSNKLSEEEMEELAMSETAIREAIQAEHVFMQDEIERWQYEQREKAVRDYISGLDASWQEGMEEGLERGMEQATVKNLENLMRQMDLSPQQAMEALRIPPTERKKYQHLLDR